MDTAKTSTLEGAATTVYAQGGQGNPRLIAWEGEKTLTFTIEDALLSDVSLSMLTGAGLINIDPQGETKFTCVHSTFDVVVEADGTTNLKAVIKDDNGNPVMPWVSNSMPAYGVKLGEAGSPVVYLTKALSQKQGEGNENVFVIPSGEGVSEGDIVRIDCYIKKTAGKIVEIEARKFAGYYYIEASTLFRDEATGQDFPAEFVIPRGKIQTNFTFTMAASGDPSTFTFTIDAFPAYTKFDKVDGGTPKKVLAAIQIIDDIKAAEENVHYNETTEPIPAPQHPLPL